MKAGFRLRPQPPPREFFEQQTLAQYLNTLGVLWCHVPNGGTRRRKEAAMLIGQGVKRGVPDNLIFSRPPLWTKRVETPSTLTWIRPANIACEPIGIAIELKRCGATPSAISTEQRQWGERLAECGWYWFVARGAGEAIGELKALGYGGRR